MMSLCWLVGVVDGLGWLVLVSVVLLFVFWCLLSLFWYGCVGCYVILCCGELILMRWWFAMDAM